MIKEIKKCRICGNTDLAQVLDLGDQASTGIFPEAKSRKVDSMPLQLVKCMDKGNPAACGLLQLKHTGDLSTFYGKDYGYRSGLNASMVRHLHGKVQNILKYAPPRAGDLVIDVGSNDSTLLQAYPKDLTLVGLDPTGVKFKHYYPEHVQLIPEFFSAAAVRAKFGEKKAKILTSISMFYDLEEPLSFVRQVHEVLDQEGIWVFEQSYMPTMLAMNSYDTVCHEHLEYYALKQIRWMAEKVGFELLDVEFNDINGGSFSVMAGKKGSQHKPHSDRLNAAYAAEDRLHLETLAPYQEFEKRIVAHKSELLGFLNEAKRTGKKVYGYGASTKGNVLLQYCGLTEKELPCIAEVNKDKFGCFTPGTLIPIISEQEAKSARPEYFMVLPWHFRDHIVKKEQEYLASGGKLVFPLPKLEIVSGNA